MHETFLRRDVSFMHPKHIFERGKMIIVNFGSTETPKHFTIKISFGFPIIEIAVDNFLLFPPLRVPVLWCL